MSTAAPNPAPAPGRRRAAGAPAAAQAAGRDRSDPPTSVVGEAAGRRRGRARWCRAAASTWCCWTSACPGASGLTLAAAWPRCPQAPAVVFVTAHAEHALHGLRAGRGRLPDQTGARERLQAALQRVAQRRRVADSRPPADAAVLVVNDRGRLLRLPLAEVLYLKAELKYVTLRTAERSYVLDDALADLEQRLGDAFLRVHRNALVARRAVRELARRAEPEAETEGGEGWAVRVAPPTSGWRCRAASWRRCARRWRRLTDHPVLRRPAAMPLIEMWMPRCSRSWLARARAGRGSGAAVPPAGGSAGRGRGSGARSSAPAPGSTPAARPRR